MPPQRNRRHWIAAVAVVFGLVVAPVAGAASRRSAASLTQTLTASGATFETSNDAASTGFGASPCVLNGHAFSPVVDGRTPASGDAFDGGMMVGVGGGTFKDPDGIGTLSGQTLTAGPQMRFGLQVSETATALATSPTLRVLITLKNPSRAAISTVVVLDSALGTQGNEATVASSSGDMLFRRADRWLVSQYTSGGEDARVTEVLFGKGAVASKVAKVLRAPGEGCITVRYDVHVPSKSTRYLMAFVELHDTAESAQSDAAKFNSVTKTSSVMADIGSKVRKKILNWKF